MPDDKERDKEKAVTEKGEGGRSSAEDRVREIKRKKELAKQAAEAGSGEAPKAEGSEDAKSAAEARVREIKRKKELAKRAAEAGSGEAAKADGSEDAKSAAEARVREIKRKKEEAKRAAEAGTDEASKADGNEDAKSAAEARVREIKRKKELAKQAAEAGESGSEGAKLSAEERVREIKRKKEEAKRAKAEANANAGEGSADAKMTAQERVREIKRKKELAKQAAAEGGVPKEDGKSEREKKIAAMKAKARAKKEAGGAGKAKAQPEAPVEPSPNEPLLEKYVKVIREKVGDGALEEAYINRLAKDVPTVVAKPETYRQIAKLLKGDEALAFDYLADIHGGDYETHMEVYVHLYSFRNRQPIALKVKVDRNDPEIDSLAPLWKGADWPERETYDLLGIRFRGHPNLKRIMMPDDWVGHPLRKDYEPYDVEV